MSSRALVLVLTLLYSGSPAAAQQLGTIRGQVVDSQGAVYASAQILLVNISSLDTTRVTADNLGRFEFRDLPFGEYQLIGSVGKSNPCELAALKAVMLKDSQARSITLKLRWNKKCTTT